MSAFQIYQNGKQIAGILDLPKDFEAVGIFESLRTYRGKIFRLDEHVRRFLESARTAGFEIPAAKVKKEISLAWEMERDKLAGGDAFIRVTFWEGEFVVMIGSRKHPEEIYRNGVALKTSPVKRTHSNASPAEAKTTAYQNAVYATIEPSDGVYEWLFLDHQGFVTEVRIGNIFIIKDGALLTPPTAGILNGVTRRFVIECARKIKRAVREIPLTRHEIFNADEAFLTNTSWEILPIRELDGRRIGEEIPGPLTQRLHKTFKTKVTEECP